MHVYKITALGLETNLESAYPRPGGDGLNLGTMIKTRTKPSQAKLTTGPLSDTDNMDFTKIVNSFLLKPKKLKPKLTTGPIINFGGLNLNKMAKSILSKLKQNKPMVHQKPVRHRHKIIGGRDAIGHQPMVVGGVDAIGHQPMVVGGVDAIDPVVGGIDAIIGGDNANEWRRAPWTAGIRLQLGAQSRAHCGGTIYNEYWILSAAHCFHRIINT